VPVVSTLDISEISATERFLGRQSRVVSRTQSVISNYVKAEWLEVYFPGNELPEEQGRLYLFPVDDNKFCLQLFFLQHAEGAIAANVCSLQFSPGFFDQYPPAVLMANQPFRFDETTEQQFSICSQTRILLEQLQQRSSLTPLIKALQQGETSMHLLRRSLECITIPFAACQVPACRFLAIESERDKIHEARNLIEQQLDQQLTIRELSRKVAMNECYLKKGFKALTGKTIHEYQHELRINKARELLQQQDQSVSDVANILGYSSISHFSTAFKKATGLKPCELLK
jgi:AraC-like DNA-binding protein